MDKVSIAWNSKFHESLNPFQNAHAPVFPPIHFAVVIKLMRCMCPLNLKHSFISSIVFSCSKLSLSKHFSRRRFSLFLVGSYQIRVAPSHLPFHCNGKSISLLCRRQKQDSVKVNKQLDMQIGAKNRRKQKHAHKSELIEKCVCVCARLCMRNDGCDGSGEGVKSYIVCI